MTKNFVVKNFLDFEISDMQNRENGGADASGERYSRKNIKNMSFWDFALRYAGSGLVSGILIF